MTESWGLSEVDVGLLVCGLQLRQAHHIPRVVQMNVHLLECDQ
jgi:hypothetical protein